MWLRKWDHPRRNVTALGTNARRDHHLTHLLIHPRIYLRHLNWILFSFDAKHSFGRRSPKATLLIAKTEAVGVSTEAFMPPARKRSHVRKSLLE